MPYSEAHLELVKWHYVTYFTDTQTQPFYGQGCARVDTDGGILTKYPHNSMIILSRHTILLFIALSLLSWASSLFLVRRGPASWPTSSPWAQCCWWSPPCRSHSCSWSRSSRWGSHLTLLCLSLDIYCQVNSFFTLSLNGYPFVLGVNCATKLSIQFHKKGTNLLIYFDFFELSHDHSNLLS